MAFSPLASAEKLERRIHTMLPKLKLISFDVFDTLITRRVRPPERMLVPAAKRFQTLLQAAGRHDDLRAIQSDRRAVEEALRREARERGLDGECGATAIFCRWARRYTNGVQAKEWARQAMTAEFQAEMQSIQPLPGMPELVRDLQQQVRVVFITDMYLAPDQIRRLLRQCGYEAAQDDLFVSASCGVNKSSGRLFQHVLKTLDVAPSTWLHVGDNRHSDVAMPRQLGGQSLLFQDKNHALLIRRTGRLAQLERHDPFWSGACLLEHCAPFYGQNVTSTDVYYDIGYWTLGPLLANFIHRVIDYVSSHAIRLILFPAREGYALKRIFDCLAEVCGVSARTDYAFLNRATCVGAALEELGPRELQDGFCALKQKSLEALLLRYRLNPQDLQSAAEQCGLSMEETFDWPYDDPRLVAFGHHQAVRDALSEQRQAYRAALADYLAQHAFWSCGEAALVDVGCRATTQDRLFEAFGHRPDWPVLHGCYMLLMRTPSLKPSPRNQHHGFMQEVPADPVAAGAYRRFVPLFELATRAPHATAVKLRRLSDRHVVPVLKKEDTAGRQAEVDSRRVATNLQRGILDVAEAYARVLPFTTAGTAEIGRYFIDRVDSFLRMPSTDEARALVAMKHVDDFGADAIAAVTAHLRPWHPGDWRHLGQSRKWLEGALATSGLPMLPALYNLWRAVRVKDY